MPFALARCSRTLRSVNGIGFREIVALGVLIVAGIIGFMFLDPTASQGGTDTPPTISLGETPPTASATPADTPTPLPGAVAMPAPTRWRITYFDRFISGGYGQIADGARDGVLELEFPGPPFNDSRDDAWKVEASIPVQLEPGRWSFAVEYDCMLRVTLGSDELLAAENPESPQTAEVTFVLEGGDPELRLSCEDTGGPTLLRWLN